MGRPRVYVVVGPGYPIAVSENPFSAGYPGRGQTVILSWRKQDILGFPHVAGHDDRSVESLDASPKRSTFETGRFAGGADPQEGGGDPDLELRESTGIGGGVDPEEGGALLDDPRRRNEERDPENAARVSSSE